MNTLEAHLDRLRETLSATQVSLLLYAGSSADRQIGLFHAGNDAPAPELADALAAESLVSGSLSSQRSERFPSRDAECHLLSVPVQTTRIEQPRDRRSFRPQEPSFWLGVRGVDDGVLQAQLPMIELLVRLCGQLFAHEQRRADPETGLPDRAEFERTLGQMRRTALDEQQSLTLYLLARDPFAASPRPWRESLAALETQLRASDELFRYTLDSLALIAIGLDANGQAQLGEKLCNALMVDAQNSARAWTVAAIRYQPNALVDQSPLTISLAAETALRQSQSNPAHQSMLLIDNESGMPVDGASLSGILCGEPTRDYRNMQLLWDTLNRLSDATAPEQLALDMIDLLAERLVIEAALISSTNDATQLLASNVPALTSVPASVARGLRDLDDGTVLDALSIDDRWFHCFSRRRPGNGGLQLLIQDRDASLRDPGYRLLQALVDQLLLAFDRLQSTQAELEQHSRTTAALRRQVAALGGPGTSLALESEAPAMQRVISQAKAWAATDEIVLITGESGSGKEVFARQIHRLSNRASAPMITVDCASIPATLMEAELFGRIRGAYTGADSEAEGYVRKAAGGTLFLDEIGELPLESQSKLLRLLQEKQVSPVGSSDVYIVDVRIIAATNRDLSTEVEAGRFRADLMYRLQVLELDLPPLRQRSSDIVPLANDFLAEYNQQYGRALTLSAEAQTVLTSHRWPGNVRELKHRILKAHLQCAEAEISSNDLALPLAVDRSPPAALEPREHVGSATHNAQALQATQASVAPTAAAPTPELTEDDLWRNLRVGLERSCETAISAGLKVPIGTWLTNALLESAYTEHNGVAKHAAIAVGLAESTFRRQFERLQMQKQSGTYRIHELFEHNGPWIEALLKHRRDASASPPLDQARSILLDVLMKRLPQEIGLASALFGVTPPTYRRYLEDRRGEAA
ncbi:MAG: sigma-54 dependent transcriptional regulator [Pseudomonadota bacterium]